MGVFDYKNQSTAESKALLADALAISVYAYHNLDNGLAEGYQDYGIGLGLPLTLYKGLFGSSTSQGGLAGVPGNPDSELAATQALNAAGWTTISAEQLGYTGKVDSRGTFYGEKDGYTTAQVEILGKYASDGSLLSVGVAFRGTTGPREVLLSDTIGDVVSDLLAAFGPDDYATNYTLNAFEQLLTDVAAFAASNGLSGDDVVVSGHSLGGIAVNSFADLSADNWSGFYQDANYLALASPTQSTTGNNVLNVGYENDPVFRVLEGSTFDAKTSLGEHDADLASATNNIVNFNDLYASDALNLAPFSILNVSNWLTHLPNFYDDGFSRILDSDFYNLTSKDSTIIVASLSDPARAKTWVQDLNRTDDDREGSTFIIGSEHNDLLQGGSANDYLEGREGNDTFRDSSGYNTISGGDGRNTLDLQRSLSKFDIANDGAGTLYVRNSEGEITIANNIDTLISKESSFLFFTKEVSHNLSDTGLVSSRQTQQYDKSVNGNSADNTLKASSSGDWLFGLVGNDTLIGSWGADVFVGAQGDDMITSGGGRDTFLFNGEFGHDSVYGFSANDTLVFSGIEGVDATASYQNHAQEVGNDTVLSFGTESVTLIGVGLATLASAEIVIA